MGIAELDNIHRIITITSHIITYGDGADDILTERIREEIERMWNEPQGVVFLKDEHFRLTFRITAETKKDISELEVLQNTDPRNNYFRIENFIHGNISFVDGIGCNTGFFLTENLYEGSTTAAHEYGHTLGLDHPKIVDIRGEGVPGIMYPRGTFVDPPYQYDPKALPGKPGGTMHPAHRKVKQQDIDNLKLHRLLKRGNKVIVGQFTSIYHWPHPVFK